MMTSPVASQSRVVIVFDATKDRTEEELKTTVKEVRLRDDILREGDILVVLGVLQSVIHPSNCLKNYIY